MNKTVTIQIGNSDNKLSQKSWSLFVESLRGRVTFFETKGVHFSSGSRCEDPWQNYCIVIETDESQINALKSSIANLCGVFGQDSIAFTIGDTEFLKNEVVNEQ